MKVLVLGQSGFIGAAVGRELRARGHVVVPTLSHGWSLDIRDAEACVSIVAELRPEAVVNLVGSGATQNSASPEEMHSINVVGAGNVARAVRAAHAPTPLLIHVASRLEPAQANRAESPYAATKAMGSALVRQEMHGADLALIRLGNVFGPGMPSERLVMTLLKELSQQRVVQLRWPHRIRDFCFIDDAVSAIAAVLETRACGTHVVASRRPVSLIELAWMIADLVGAPRDLVRAAPSQHDAFGDLPDLESTSSLITCDTALHDGLERMLRSLV